MPSSPAIFVALLLPVACGVEHAATETADAGLDRLADAAATHNEAEPDAAISADDAAADDASTDDEADLAQLTDISTPAGFALSVAEMAPADNALTEERAQLGKRLFFDTLLSRDETVACGSCHLQEHGFADPRAVSLGVDDKQGKRNASQLANLAWVQTGLFWDGRVKSLEEQAGKPIEDAAEMDLPMDEAIARLKAHADYPALFEQAYDAPPSADTLTKAIASFVRTLVSANSSYDRYLAGDEEALSAAQVRGLELFLSSQTGCFHCHSELTLTNDGFFNNGSFEDGGDPGRQALTGRTGDLGKFRVPNLRNVAVTGPYMHDGSLETLEAVVEQYVAGGRGHASTDAQIEPLSLSDKQQADLVAFLESLTDETFLGDPRYRP